MDDESLKKLRKEEAILEEKSGITFKKAPNQQLDILENLADAFVSINKNHKINNLLELTGEMAKVGSWEFDVKTQKGTWSREVAQIHDMNPNDETNVEIGLEVYIGESRVKIEKAIEKVIADGTPYDLELEMISTKGIHKWVRTKGFPVIDDGKTVKVCGIFQDISEFKTAEINLENERTQLRTLIGTIPDLIWLKDMDGVYLSLNRRFEELIGFSAEETIGKTDYELFPKELADFFRANDANAAKANKPTTNLEELTFATNGYRGLFETIKTPMYNNSGTMIGILGVARDVTSLKKAEEEVVAVNNQLSILVKAIQELSSARDLASIMKIVRTHARQLVGADGATFVLRDGDRCFYADEDAIEPLWKGQRFPLEECISGWSMLNKQQVVIEDIYADQRIPIDAYKPTFVKSLTMTPIRIADPIGSIGAYWATNHTPSDVEKELLQTLADTTTRAVENVQLLDELDRRVKERTAELEQKNIQLERMNKLFIGRELRMAELKKEMATLQEKLQNREI